MTNTPRIQKPTIVRHTKASRLARDSTLQAESRPRRSLLNQPQPRKRRSLITTREALKQRPSWDMRGKVSDLEAQLEKNNHQLENLHRFRDELALLNEEKDSERKQALQKAIALKTEIQTLDKTHAQEMENQRARQRIHYQELKDQHFIYKRQEGTMEMALEDARRKLDQAEARMAKVTQERQQLLAKSTQMTTEHQRLEQELHHVEIKSKRFQGTLAERERDIQRLQLELDKELPGLEAAELKLQKARAINQRLSSRIKELET